MSFKSTKKNFSKQNFVKINKATILQGVTFFTMLIKQHFAFNFD